MAIRRTIRIPEVKTLWDILPKGTEGGKEFARIVDLLRFHDARRNGRDVTIFSDVAGDYHGLDGLEKAAQGNIGFQYKFYPSSLSSAHRAEIEKSLLTTKKQKSLKLKKWILVTPQDPIESATRKDGGDVTWFESLQKKLSLRFKLEHWGHRNLQALFLHDQTLCLYYYPELVEEGATRQRTIQDLRSRFDAAVEELYQEIHFVGVAVREQKTAQGIPMKDIYIPLDVLPEGISDDNARRKPSELVAQGARTVVLGDPGSGKSTLLKFIALAGRSDALQARYGVAPDARLPILVVLRRYAHELTTRRTLGIREYVIETLKSSLSLPVDDAFLDFYLESGQALLLFDGMDELPDSSLRMDVRDRINTFVACYPHNTVVVSSRFVGYDGPCRFRKETFNHYQVAPLRLPQMRHFVTDWYTARIPNTAERGKNINDLTAILEDPNHQSIRDLAANPLLLTIIALVHRIEADLPDERVLLYRKCTETLLSTWNNYKGAETGDRKPGRAERRNLYRIEAIAYWMQARGGPKGRERAVVQYLELRKFLTDYISESPNEPKDQENEADQLADLFLTFVRKEAGLLIEAGADLYSFVHLTFQEYLAAEHIKRQAGVGGVEAVWKQIGPHLSDSKWHEVLRLLIAGYEQPEAEAVLVERILDLKNGDRYVTELLGGLLVDGVVAAEERQEAILPMLMLSCEMAESPSSLATLLDLLKAWVARTENPGPLFDLATRNLGSESRTLLSQLIGMNTEIEPTRLRYFLGSPMRPEDEAGFAALQGKARRFDWWAVQSAGANLGSAILHAIDRSDSVLAVSRSFCKLLFLAPYIGIAGDFHGHTAWLTGERFLGPLRDRARDRDLARDRARYLVYIGPWDRDPDRDRGRDRDLARARGRDLDLNRALALNRDLARARARALARALARDLDRGPDQDPDLTWNDFLSSPRMFGPHLRAWVRGFELSPAPLWTEFLRARVLPSLPQRANLHDEGLWATTFDRMRSNSFSELDQWLAARHMLVEADFVALGVFNAAAPNPLTGLAEATQTSDFPAIRIAHAILDISYKRPSGIRDLRALLDSKDPAYQSIFREAYWID